MRLSTYTPARVPPATESDRRPGPGSVWVRLVAGGIVIAAGCMAAWVAMERAWFPDADTATLRTLYLARGFTSSLLLMLYAGLFVMRHHLRTTAALEAAVEARTAELRKQTQFHERVLQNAMDAIVLADGRGRITHFNPAAEGMFGYLKSEALQRSVSDLVGPASRRSLEEVLARMTEAGSGARRRPVLEGEGLRKDGSVFPVECAVGSWSDEGQRVAMGVVRDISDRRQAATALRQAEEQMRHAQRLDAVGRLAGGIAHDFNNLLTSVLGYAELLLDRTPQGEGRLELEEIRRAGQRAAALTRQLLAFSRKQVLQPMAVDLNIMITEMHDFLRRLIGETIRLEVKPARTLGTVRVDRTQIEQVLMNLAINGRDAMASGGTLTIETENAELDEAYSRSHVDVAPGRYVMLSVSDTGTGMDAATLTRLFEPFFTTKGQGKGTGLGLATSHGIVRQSGGHIWVYSEPGKGSTFKIYLPRVNEAPDRSAAAPEEASTHGTEALLVVEDDDAVRGVVRDALRRFGYTVHEAADGARAEALAVEHAAHIRLLLTDVVMPGVHGRELAARLCRIIPGLPVLFMSGYTENAIVHHGVLDPGTEFIEKPLVPIVLARRIRGILDRTRRGP